MGMTGRTILHPVAALLALGTAIAMAHFCLIAALYPTLPPAIPAFVDIAGKPVVSLAKSPLAAVRLPLMGLAAQVACWAMCGVAIGDRRAQQANRVLWASIALMVTGKMLLSSLDIITLQAPGIHTMLRLGVIGLSGMGALALVGSAAWLFSYYRSKQRLYMNQVEPATRAWLLAAGAAYAALVLMPWWLR